MSARVSGTLSSKMNPGRPHLLLTNDDGYDAEGIRELSKVLRGYGKVTLIGPDRE